MERHPKGPRRRAQRSLDRRSLYTEAEIRRMSDADLISRYCVILFHGTFTHALLAEEMKRRNLL